MTEGDAVPVAILVVTHEDGDDLPACLRAVGALDPAPAELVIVDSGSSDDSVAVARGCWPGDLAGEIVPLGENRGFSGGMNRGLEVSRSPWVLTLNADAEPEPEFLAELLAPARGFKGGRVGAVAGRLVRPGEPRRLDACGMRLTLTWRHLDRGSGEPDRGQHSRPGRVFGATGAASLFSREALEDVAVEGEVFDPLFFAWREDAELCFRLRERGWEVLYAPRAIAVHRRTSLPSRRRRLPAAATFHSLKNRYLLRAYHQTLPNAIVTAPFALSRDLGALAWVLVLERSSLAAYRWLWRHRRQIRRRARTIRRRRTAGLWAVERWFLRRWLPLPAADTREGP